MLGSERLEVISSDLILEMIYLSLFLLLRTKQ